MDDIGGESLRVEANLPLDQNLRHVTIHWESMRDLGAQFDPTVGRVSRLSLSPRRLVTSARRSREHRGLPPCLAFCQDRLLAATKLLSCPVIPGRFEWCWFFCVCQLCNNNNYYNNNNTDQESAFYVKCFALPESRDIIRLVMSPFFTSPVATLFTYRSRIICVHRETNLFTQFCRYVNRERGDRY